METKTVNPCNSTTNTTTDISTGNSTNNNKVFEWVFHPFDCEQRLPCGKCKLTGKECDKQPPPDPVYVPCYPYYVPYDPTPWLPKRQPWDGTWVIYSSTVTH